MEYREELKLYQELKEIALPSSGDTLNELLKKKDIYDINPNTNFKIMKKYIEFDDDEKIMEEDNFDEQFTNFYLYYNQTLTFNQKSEIINKIKTNNKGELIKKLIGFNEKSNMENYFDILNILKSLHKTESVEEYSNFKNLFFTKYYIDNESIKIPLIYGTNQLKYGGLISNLYKNLFIINSENNEGNNIKEEQYKNNHNYPENIIEKKENKLKDNINVDSAQRSIKIKEVNENFIFYKIIFISKYLDKICDKEFYEFFNINEQFQLDESKKFEPNYKLNPHIDALFFHLLYFDLIFSIYSINGDNYYMDNFESIFFEFKSHKLYYLRILNKIFKFIKCENNQVIEFNISNDIQNADYLLVDLKDEKNTLKFNPYDYSFLKLKNSNIKTFNDAKKAFNNPKYFSLNLIYKNKRLFNDEKLFKLFEENIKNMLNSNAIDELYNQYKNFKEFNNPYKNEEFIKQTFDIILYLPIPFKIIGGFTSKNFGLIFLNNIELNKRNDLPTIFFCKSISHLSFKKVTIIHEVLSHNTSVIIHANKKEIGLLTPPNTFTEYFPKDIYIDIYSNYDRWDKGDSILFGNKIKDIFIKGALFILDNENWKLNLEDFRSKFIFLNNPNNSKNENFNVNEESSKDKIIDYLIKNNSDLIKIFETKENLSFSFKLNSEFNDENEFFKDGVLYLNRVSHKSIVSKKINKK